MSEPLTSPGPTTTSPGSSQREALGQFDNTLVIVICGDNGMSAEGSLNGTADEVYRFNAVTLMVEEMTSMIPVWGSAHTRSRSAGPWAFARPPYRWCRQVVPHLGGTRRHGQILAKTDQGCRQHT